MLFDSVFQSKSEYDRIWASCDLMLFDSVFQSERINQMKVTSCDLMLFDSVFQYALGEMVLSCQL